MTDPDSQHTAGHTHAHSASGGGHHHHHHHHDGASSTHRQRSSSQEDVNASVSESVQSIDPSTAVSATTSHHANEDVNVSITESASS